MLSRVADNLYWMSRYLERAEHTARLLDVNLHGVLDQTPEAAERRWARLLTGLHVDLPSTDAYGITRALTVDGANPASIVCCVTAARDNARQAWEQINSEMWEQMNRLFLHISRTSMDEIWLREPHAFFTSVKEGAHLFQGITDATMGHGEGWQFIRVGRGIERTALTATLIDAHFAVNPPPMDGEAAAPHDEPAPHDESGGYGEWVGLLKSCTAFEAYVKFYSANVRPEGVAAFLLLNADFPRSLRFVASDIRAGLQAIGRAAGGRGGRPERLAGRLQAALDYSQIEEIMGDDLHLFLDFIRHQCDQIHTAIYQTFIRYPVGAALTAQAMSR